MLRILVMKRILLQYLEGHVALKSRILTAEHHSHTAFAQAFDDTISAERLTNHDSSGMVRGDNVPEVYSAGQSRASRLAGA